MIKRLKAVPPVAWVLGSLAVGLVFVCWHGFARDDTDTDWTTPKETQPPPAVPFPPAPAGHGSGRPMSCGQAFRDRSYPASLTLADFSVVIGGDCN